MPRCRRHRDYHASGEAIAPLRRGVDAQEITMPWRADYYPTSMRHLAPEVREKAIDIANALLEQGMDKGKAIRIAIAQAHQWAARRGIDEEGAR